MLSRLILVVDDDDDIRSSLLDALAPRFEVAEARGGAEALDLLRQGPELPRVVLLDVNMPRVAGPDVVVALRQDPRTAAVPIILMSARLDLAEQAAALHVQGYVSKPFDLDRLMRLLDRHCQ